MPQLSRLRFCNVGHNRARMDNLILNFQDKEGWATHSTLWLRNGGGKSSILNLFFGLLRPDRREIFGSKSEQDERKLDDYIQLDLPGVVVAEWQLDSNLRSKGSDSSEHYLTGIFYEKRSVPSNVNCLRRLFFSARVIPDEPRLTLNGLPIFTKTGGGLKCRTMTTFKQEWQAIGLQFPHAEAQETEHQSDWRQILDAAGIDSELFGYQLQMNRNESGAAELFKFRETDEFVDFFLKLVIDSNLGNQVSSNLEVFRTELRRRTEEFLPEQELICGVMERLKPLVGLADRRSEVYCRVTQTQIELAHFLTHLRDRDTALNQEVVLATQQDENARQDAHRLQEEAILCQ